MDGAAKEAMFIPALGTNLFYSTGFFCALITAFAKPIDASLDGIRLR